MVDMEARVGAVTLPNPVMTASGTSGHGAELAGYGELAQLGAVVVKSIAAFRWEGNPPLRLAPARAGMLNSVGLTGPGVVAWSEGPCKELVAVAARVVVSVWGRTVDEYAAAAKLLDESRLPSNVVAVEVNISCPNAEDRGRMFAQSTTATADAVAAVVEAIPLPVWAKLTPAVSDLVSVAGAAIGAGADALTLTNTMPAMAIDTEQRVPVLGGVTGGLSGPALHPVAVRCVYECRQAFPNVGIVGVGGVMAAADAVELMMAGASAVQVGTAIFADPRAPWKVLRGLENWCAGHRVDRVADLVGAAR